MIIKVVIKLSWLVVILPVLQLSVYIFRINNIFLYVMFALVLFLSYPTLKMPIFYEKFGVCIIFSYLLCTLLSGNIDMESLKYIALIIIFYLSLPHLGRYIAEDYKKNIRYMYYFGCTIIMFTIVRHIQEINIENISSALNIIELSTGRVRATFGFTHANTAGFNIVSMMILGAWNMKINQPSKKEHIINIAVNMFFLLALLCTGSRTGLIVIIYFYFHIFFNTVLKVLKRFAYIFMLLVGVASLYLVIGTNIISATVENSSGRDILIKNLLQAMIEQNKVLIGIGVSPISSGGISEALGMSLSFDSWYFYILASCGLIGSIVLFSGIVYVFFNMYRNTVASLRTISSASMVSLLIYGIAENLVFVPGIFISVLIWILIISAYYYSIITLKNRKVVEFEIREN